MGGGDPALSLPSLQAFFSWSHSRFLLIGCTGWYGHQRALNAHFGGKRVEFFFFFFLVCVSFNLYISVRERNDLETTNQSVL